MSVLAFLTGTKRRKVALGSSAVLIAAGTALALPSSGAANNQLTFTPANGSTISGGFSVAVPAPGCGSVSQAVLRIKGGAIAGDAPGDPGFTNIQAAQSVTAGAFTFTTGAD